MEGITVDHPDTDAETAAADAQLAVEMFTQERLG
jgi:hypothetical protein